METTLPGALGWLPGGFISRDLERWPLLSAAKAPESPRRAPFPRRFSTAARDLAAGNRSPARQHRTDDPCSESGPSWPSLDLRELRSHQRRDRSCRAQVGLGWEGWVANFLYL